MAMNADPPATPSPSTAQSARSAAPPPASVIGEARSSATAPSPQMCRVLAGNWWAVALRGVFGILFGLIALFLPGATMLSLVLLFAAYMLVDGVFAIVSAVRAARAGGRWGLLVLEGLASIATGALAFILPGLTVLAFVLLVAAWALITGGLMLGAAFRLDKAHGRWWLGLGGIVSMVYGALLIVAPLVGALVLTWWLGAYALVFGVALLVLGFKLRARREEGTGPAAPERA